MSIHVSGGDEVTAILFFDASRVTEGETLEQTWARTVSHLISTDVTKYTFITLFPQSLHFLYIFASPLTAYLIMADMTPDSTAQRAENKTQQPKPSNEAPPSPPRYGTTIAFSKPGILPPVYIAGSLTSPLWTEVEMSSKVKTSTSPPGQAEYDFFYQCNDLSGGTYQYKFKLGSGQWAIDEDQRTVLDDAGNKNNEIKMMEDPLQLIKSEAQSTKGLPTPPTSPIQSSVAGHTQPAVKIDDEGSSPDSPSAAEFIARAAQNGIGVIKRSGRASKHSSESNPAITRTPSKGLVKPDLVPLPDTPQPNVQSSSSESNDKSNAGSPPPPGPLDRMSASIAPIKTKPADIATDVSNTAAMLIPDTPQANAKSSTDESKEKSNAGSPPPPGFVDRMSANLAPIKTKSADIATDVSNTAAMLDPRRNVTPIKVTADTAAEVADSAAKLDASPIAFQRPAPAKAPTTSVNAQDVEGKATPAVNANSVGTSNLSDAQGQKESNGEVAMPQDVPGTLLESTDQETAIKGQHHEDDGDQKSNGVVQQPQKDIDTDKRDDNNPAYVTAMLYAVQRALLAIFEQWFFTPLANLITYLTRSGNK